MSKIFKIAGRYNQNCFAFSVGVVVDDEGAFCGRCGYVINPENSLIPHFVVGTLIESGEITGVAFYLVSNDAKIGATEFIVPNVKKTGKCGVGVLGFNSILESEANMLNSGSILESEANITLKSASEYLKGISLVDEETNIRERFDEINKSLYNDDKISEMELRCRIALEKAQAHYKRERGD